MAPLLPFLSPVTIGVNHNPPYVPSEGVPITEPIAISAVPAKAPGFLEQILNNLQNFFGNEVVQTAVTAAAIATIVYTGYRIYKGRK
jgi:hypothetical protein